MSRGLIKSTKLKFCCRTVVMDPLHIRHAKRMTELHLEAPMTREPAKNVYAAEELWRE